MERRLPLVSPLERALFLRAHRLLRGVSSPVVAAVAANTREVFVRKGAVIRKQDEPVDTLYFLVEGKIRVQHGDGLRFAIEPPGGAGLLWALAEREGGPAFIAEADTVVLEMPLDPFFDILEDHFQLVLQLYEVLAADLSGLEEKLGRPPRLPEPPSPPPPLPSEPLELVERLLWASRCPAFEAVNLNAVAELVRVHPEIRLAPGDILWKRDDPADFLALITHGVIDCTSPHAYRNFRAGPAVVIGVDDAIAGRSHAYTATAETPALAIRIDRQTYLDVLEDNIDLAFRGLKYFAATILETRRQLTSASNLAEL
jgi:CRP-like cAMP-binding protein